MYNTYEIYVDDIDEGESLAVRIPVSCLALPSSTTNNYCYSVVYLQRICYRKRTPAAMASISHNPRIVSMVRTNTKAGIKLKSMFVCVCVCVCLCVCVSMGGGGGSGDTYNGPT